MTGSKTPTYPRDASLHQPCKGQAAAIKMQCACVNVASGMLSLCVF